MTQIQNPKGGHRRAMALGPFGCVRLLDSDRRAFSLDSGFLRRFFRATGDIVAEVQSGSEDVVMDA